MPTFPLNGTEKQSLPMIVYLKWIPKISWPVTIEVDLTML